MTSSKTATTKKHRRPHDKPTGHQKAKLVQKLKALGWHGRDLRQVLDVEMTMAENLERFRQELHRTVRRRST